MNRIPYFDVKIIQICEKQKQYFILKVSPAAPAGRQAFYSPDLIRLISDRVRVHSHPDLANTGFYCYETSNSKMQRVKAKAETSSQWQFRING